MVYSSCSKTDRTKRQLKTPRNTAKESEEKGDYNERWIRDGVRYLMRMDGGLTKKEKMVVMDNPTRLELIAPREVLIVIIITIIIRIITYPEVKSYSEWRSNLGLVNT